MNTSPKNENEPSENKKLMGGSFAVSLGIHIALLLLLGTIIIAPGVVDKIRAVTSVAPPPVEIPPAPPENDQPDVNPDAGGSPIGEVSEDQGSPEKAEVDALVVDTPIASSPRLNASPNSSMNISDAFSKGGGGKGGSGGGTGTGTGRGSGAGFFGSKSEGTGGLKGRFYDLKQTFDGKPSEVISPSETRCYFRYETILKKFISSGWNTKVLEDYFCPEINLYATQIFIPEMSAGVAPTEFNVADKVQPRMWVIHYKGQMKAAKSGAFRFVGQAGEILVVRFNGKTILDGCHAAVKSECPVTDWSPDDKKITGQYRAFGPGPVPWNDPERLWFGDWMTFEKNKVYPLEILIGERAGGTFNVTLQIQGRSDPIKLDENGLLILSLFSASGVAQPIPDYTPNLGPAKPNMNYCVVQSPPK